MAQLSGAHAGNWSHEASHKEAAPYKIKKRLPIFMQDCKWVKDVHEKPRTSKRKKIRRRSINSYLAYIRVISDKDDKLAVYYTNKSPGCTDNSKDTSISPWPPTISATGNSVVVMYGETYIAISFGGADIAINYEHGHTSDSASTLQVLFIWLFLTFFMYCGQICVPLSRVLSTSFSTD
jgi:hypothetical protein